MTRLIVALLILCANGASAGEAIIDTRTGRLLSGVAETEPAYPASTTKLMTIYVALEAASHGDINLQDKVVVTPHAAAAPPVKLGLQAGETISLADAIHAALILSSNDAARVIADAVSGSEPAFAARMTETAHALGMRNTVFRNATGLPNRDHISTAADIARLIWRLDQRHGAYLRPLFRTALTWRGVRRGPRNATVAGVPGARLGKTGFTCAAGYTAAVLVEGPEGGRALSTLANSAPGARALSLARLVGGKVATHDFAPPCVGSDGATASATPDPRPASVGDWSLTLGVFPDRRAALNALRESRRAIGKADRVVAYRPNGRGFYAVLMASDREQAQKFRRRLIRSGLSANLIDRHGRRALDLRIHTRL